MMSNHEQNIALFAAGCFWHVEEVFRKVSGVLETVSGYTGGEGKDPTYEEVCAGNTGHAETVKVTFDPSAVSYDALVRIFFENHDPTAKDRQGPDVGRQYRSAIFTLDDTQNEVAEKIKKELEEKQKFPHAIVTEIVPAGVFYPAEEYHQKFVMKARS